MKNLLEKYHAILREEGFQQAYRSDKLKSRLKKHHKNRLVFQERGRNKYQLVYSSDISTKDAIKYASSARESTSDNVASFALAPDQGNTQILLQAAMILRSKIQESNGLRVDNISPEDISLDQANAIVPPDLYIFLRHVIDGVNDANSSSTQAEDITSHRHILSVGQDLIHMVSKGVITLFSLRL